MRRGLEFMALVIKSDRDTREVFRLASCTQKKKNTISSFANFDILN